MTKKLYRKHHLLLVLFLLLFVFMIKTNSWIVYKTNQTIYKSISYYQMWYIIASQIVDSRNILSVSRYGDGEYLIMIGKKVEGIDHFGYKGGNCILRKELYKALKCPKYGNCYYGVYYNHLDKFIKWSNIHPKYFTTSNIFVNKNYPKTKLLLESVFHDEYKRIILFCNDDAKYTSFAKIVLYFPKNIISYYETNYWSILKNVTTLAKQYNNHLFLLSIGPLAPVLIYHMRNSNINNRYIDFGSTLDEIIKGKSNRGYAITNSTASKLIDKTWIYSFNNRSISFM